MVSARKFNQIPAMTPVSVHEYLTEIGSKWKEGYAVELGCWLGAATVPLLNGLKRAGYDLDYYAFDMWRANKEQVERAALYGVQLIEGQNLFPLFQNNTKSVYNKIIANQGRMPQTLFWWANAKISIILFDAPKKPDVFVPAVRRFAPHWIPGETIVGLLDYYFFKRKSDRELIKKLKVAKRFIRKNRDSFEKLIEWPDKCSCVFFKYLGGNVWDNWQSWT